VTATYHLKPLSDLESANYILFRLAKAGWQENPEITPAAFEAIYQYTRGVPRLINTFCDRLLLYGFLEELRVIDIADAQKVFSDFVEESAVNLPQKPDVINSSMEHNNDHELVKRVEKLEVKIEQLVSLIKNWQ
jgi:hypothetical protein